MDFSQRIARWGGGLIARYLTRPSRAPYPNPPADLAAFAAVLRAGDVLLVEGNLRISTAIKYLTQSTWSHSALYVGEDLGADRNGATRRLIDADVVEGVRPVALETFGGLHLRICRPVGLSDEEIARVVAFARSRIGDRYDLKNVIDLARYLLPTPPVPSNYRRRLLALGSGEPTRAICSTLIAQAFQSIRYPILPSVTGQIADDPSCAGCRVEMLRIRHHSLFAPRDFDVSPYFRIVKPQIERGFDPAQLRWDDAPG